MEIKHDMYRDEVLLVKTEPRLHSPNGLQTANGPTNGLVTLASSSSGHSSSVTNGLTNSNGLSASSNGNGPFSSLSKRPRTDEWLPSPGGATIIGGGVGTSAPLTPSPGPPSNTYTAISNGYSSPMSSGSYDPYSPNGKIGKSLP
ncbi:PREDICTED: ecdysone receptor-like [Nicrophorus vespilloides]|uniref:Ecdysone receptor-like n=1 Tax=Nicrophorus vespilloides TaxID=110193 RepID=A0ABM1NH10_NICVS|nr:PREDICTED: ecdysone receptor-like [Nicrophorus vespilloides]XP_017786111.1 PREDICTED: ecdysone receptor-like [Nicrophorus vespilloides]XP_017786112.1 PREDICTED: ecdysone receptor-like [Nicrophorus vespilloides]XP_017786113.1 PREDICTED: ecdysone receptor-like [Nicrophorus vespilloides]XP_017786114.1 PREDICTED: ecdysone receptor-like [Nicrophorus vespilloides]